MTVCPCGRVAALLARPAHLAGLCAACAVTVCDDPDDPGYDVWNPEDWRRGVGRLGW